MPRRNNRLKPAESNAYRTRLFALDLTQNDAARMMRVKSGPFSRWIRGEYTSARNRKKLDTLLAREEAKRGRTDVAAGGAR
jgi:hypothetical protein